MTGIRKWSAIAIALTAVTVGAIVAIVSSKGARHHHAGSALARRLDRKGSHRRPEIATAAAYLGITTAQLSQDLRSGRTLAQIAESTAGRSAAGLIDALVQRQAQRLRAGEESSSSASARSARRLANLRRRIARRVERQRSRASSEHSSDALSAPGALP